MTVPDDALALGRHPPGYAAAVETHTGAVLFVGELAYKVKKPVQMAFVDWRDRTERRAACAREVALNRRLVEGMYLGVGELRPPDAEPEPAVVMRRLPDDRRLSTLVRAGVDVEEPLRHLAHQLAAFHLGAPSSVLADDEAGAIATLRRWETNQRTLAGYVGRYLDRDVAREVVRRGHAVTVQLAAEASDRQVVLAHRAASRLYPSAGTIDIGKGRRHID